MLTQPKGKRSFLREQHTTNETYVWSTTTWNRGEGMAAVRTLGTRTAKSIESKGMNEITKASETYDTTKAEEPVKSYLQPESPATHGAP